MCSLTKRNDSVVLLAPSAKAPTLSTAAGATAATGATTLGSAATAVPATVPTKRASTSAGSVRSDICSSSPAGRGDGEGRSLHLARPRRRSQQRQHLDVVGLREEVE